MIEQELNSEIQSKLEQFAKMESIIPSESWESTLDRKLRNNKRGSNAALNIKVGVVVLILIINLGFILTSVFNKNTFVSKQEPDLDLISKELLVNPTSIAN